MVVSPSANTAEVRSNLGEDRCQIFPFFCKVRKFERETEEIQNCIEPYHLRPISLDYIGFSYGSQTLL